MKKSDIQKYWEEKNYSKFNLKLKGYIGFITRYYCKGFKQSSELYKELFDGIVVVVYQKLNFFDPEKGSFLTFLRNGIIRNELTKWFNKYNRERLHLSINDCYKEFYDYDFDITYNNIIDKIKKIKSKYNLKSNIYDLELCLIYKNCYKFLYKQYINDGFDDKALLLKYELILVSWELIHKNIV